jgi:hypothetical protein
MRSALVRPVFLGLILLSPTVAAAQLSAELDDELLQGVLATARVLMARSGSDYQGSTT